MRRKAQTSRRIALLRILRSSEAKDLLESAVRSSLPPTTLNWAIAAELNAVALWTLAGLGFLAMGMAIATASRWSDIGESAMYRLMAWDVGVSNEWLLIAALACDCYCSGRAFWEYMLGFSGCKIALCGQSSHPTRDSSALDGAAQNIAHTKQAGFEIAIRIPVPSGREDLQEFGARCSLSIQQARECHIGTATELFRTPMDTIHSIEYAPQWVGQASLIATALELVPAHLFAFAAARHAQPLAFGSAGNVCLSRARFGPVWLPDRKGARHSYSIVLQCTLQTRVHSWDSILASSDRFGRNDRCRCCSFKSLRGSLGVSEQRCSLGCVVSCKCNISKWDLGIRTGMPATQCPPR